MKKYYCSEGMLTNLFSMLDTIWCCIYDIQDGKFETVEIMGENKDERALYDFLDEVDDLISQARYTVDGKTYGRIKEISDARNIMRYATCLDKGMDESDASLAFF